MKKILEKKYKYIVVDGEYYEWGSEDGKPILKKVSKAKIKGMEKICEKIAHKIKEGLNAEVLLKEILMTNLSEKDLKKLHKLLFESKRKYKPKTREHHCVDMTVGRFIIPLAG